MEEFGKEIDEGRVLVGKFKKIENGEIERVISRVGPPASRPVYSSKVEEINKLRKEGDNISSKDSVNYIQASRKSVNKVLSLKRLEAKELFKKCDTFHFYMSNQNKNFPVSCLIKKNDLSIFINFNQALGDSFDISDASKIQYGVKEAFLDKKTLDIMSEQALMLFNLHKHRMTDTFTESYLKFFEYRKETLFSKFYNLLVTFFNGSKPRSKYPTLAYEDVSKHLASAKEVDIINVYP